MSTTRKLVLSAAVSLAAVTGIAAPASAAVRPQPVKWGKLESVAPAGKQPPGRGFRLCVTRVGWFHIVGPCL